MPVKQVYIAFYLSIVLGFLRAILRKVLTVKVDYLSTAKYFLMTSDYHDSSIYTLVGTVAEHHDAPGWQNRLCNKFVDDNGFKETLGTLLCTRDQLPDPIPEEINSPESPYSGWMNERLERAALKLARDYPWFHPAIFNDSNYPE